MKYLGEGGGGVVRVLRRAGLECLEEGFWTRETGWSIWERGLEYRGEGSYSTWEREITISSDGLLQRSVDSTWGVDKGDLRSSGGVALSVTLAMIDV